MGIIYIYIYPYILVLVEKRTSGHSLRMLFFYAEFTYNAHDKDNRPAIW